MNIVLRPVNLRWINDAADDPADFCAHGEVEFRIGGDTLVTPATTKGCTLSAAGLYLLRTLSKPHTRESPVGEHLFPCCGFTLYDLCGEQDVVVQGCPSGVDVEVLHRTAGDGVTLRAADSREWEVSSADWRAAVFGFADLVSDFYGACSPKQVTAEDADGYAKFIAEWERRRGRAFGRRV